MDAGVVDQGDFFHQLASSVFRVQLRQRPKCPFDKWFGTYHDGSEEATKRTRYRKREMHAK